MLFLFQTASKAMGGKKIPTDKLRIPEGIKHDKTRETKVENKGDEVHFHVPVTQGQDRESIISELEGHELFDTDYHRFDHGRELQVHLNEEEKTLRVVVPVKVAEKAPEIAIQSPTVQTPQFTAEEIKTLDRIAEESNIPRDVLEKYAVEKGVETVEKLHNVQVFTASGSIREMFLNAQMLSLGGAEVSAEKIPEVLGSMWKSIEKFGFTKEAEDIIKNTSMLQYELMYTGAVNLQADIYLKALAANTASSANQIGAISSKITEDLGPHLDKAQLASVIGSATETITQNEVFRAVTDKLIGTSFSRPSREQENLAFNAMRWIHDQFKRFRDHLTVMTILMAVEKFVSTTAESSIKLGEDEVKRQEFEKKAREQAYAAVEQSQTAAVQETTPVVATMAGKRHLDLQRILINKDVEKVTTLDDESKRFYSENSPALLSYLNYVNGVMENEEKFGGERAVSVALMMGELIGRGPHQIDSGRLEDLKTDIRSLYGTDEKAQKVMEFFDDPQKLDTAAENLVKQDPKAYMIVSDKGEVLKDDEGNPVPNLMKISLELANQIETAA